MMTSIIVPVILIAALIISMIFNFYQKRDRSKTLRLLAIKNQNIMLAMRAGNIAVWGYDVKGGRLYNIEGKVFVEDEVSIEQAMSGVHPDDGDAFARVLRGVVQGVIPGETICIRFMNPFTGGWEYIEKEFAVIKSRTGEVETVIGTHKDVTKRVLEAEKTDELLRKFRKLYNENQTILNTLPTGVTIYNKEGKLFYMNHTMCKILDVRDRKKLLETQLSIWDNRYLSKEVKTKLEEGENAAFTYQIDCNTLSPQYYNPTDKTLYMSCISNVIRNECSQVEGYIFIHRDITLQEMQQKEIQDMSETLIHVIDASGFSVWEYMVKERKFCAYRGEMFVENGLSYEDAVAKLTVKSAHLCNTIFEKMVEGRSPVEHVLFEFNDSDIGNKATGFYQCELVARKDAEGNVVKIYGIQKEITNEMNYHIELEESKLKTQLAVYVSNMVQWDYDVDKHIFHTVNEKWEGNVMTADDYYKVTHPDDLPELMKIIELMDSKSNETFEFDVRFKFPSDNHWQYITVTGTPLKQDKNGEVIKYTGFQRNNTQWHLLAEELKQKDEMNNLIMNSMSSGLVYLSPDQTVIWENTSKKFSLDFSGENMLFEVGKHCHQTHLGIAKECDICMLKGVWENHDSIMVERTLDNGNVLEIEGNPVINDEGELIGTILRIDDITQRKQTIKKLKAAEMEVSSANQLLFTILDSLPSSIFVKDASDGYRYIMVNKKFCEVFGLMESDVIGKTDYDIFSSRSEADKYRSDDIATIESNRTTILHEELVSMKDSVVVWHTIKTPLINVDNTNQRLLVGIGLDITERHNAYQQLDIARKKAEESDKLKSAFLANMSHEIRTPPQCHRRFF